MKNKVEVKKVSLTNRRNFLKLSGLAVAGTGLLLAGCSDDDDGGNNNNNNNQQHNPGMINGAFDFGSGDIGILTYAYALEQLEADFYTRVVNNGSFGSTWNSDEQAMLAEIYSHEVVHRETLRQLVTTAVNNNQSMILPTLQFNWADVSFGNRNTVLQTAQMLEDTGVAAYTGAGRYLDNVNNLVLAGKIVSVEGRHASVIRSMINPNNGYFAGPDVVEPATGKNEAMKPSEVVSMLDSANYITTQFSANYLP
jgi:hypothetical protein